MSNELMNDLTSDFDKYNICYNNEDVEWSNVFRTYLCIDDLDYHRNRKESLTLGFRVPGATRGHIAIDEDMIITDIRFYEDTCFKDTVPYGVSCYTRDIIDGTKHWIGKKLSLEGEYK